MAIQFLCPACSQPIEVDDEWAGKPVACPFCHQSVTAPTSSTLGDSSPIPTASPIAPIETPSFPTVNVGNAGRPNRIALVAFVLACSVVGLMMAATAIMRQHSTDLRHLQRQLQDAQSPVEVMMKYRDDQGGQLPGWLVALTLLEFAVLGLAAAAFVCAMIGLRRPQRRGMAVAALIILGLVPVLFCCGGPLIPPASGE